MRRMLIAAGIAVGLAGCAESAYDLRQDAARHEWRAQIAASHGDYRRADWEQRRAYEDRRRAAAEDYEDWNYGPRTTVAPPAPAPATPPPYPY